MSAPGSLSSEERPPLGSRLLSSQRLAWPLVAIVLFGGFLRFFRLHQPQLWLDELLRLLRFSHDSLWLNLSDIRADVAAVPLDYLVQNLFVSWWGVSAVAARFHAALFGSVAIVAMFWLGKLLFARKVALLATILLAVHPLHLFYSREGANYALFHLLVLIAYGCLWRALSVGGAWWGAYGVVSALCLYTNYLATTFVASQIVWVLILFLRPRSASSPQWDEIVTGKTLRRFAAALFLAGMAFLPWVLWTYSAPVQNYPNPLDLELPIRLVKEFSGGSYPLALLMGGPALYGAYLLGRRRQVPLLTLFLTWGLVPLLLTLFLVWWRGYFFSVRQILPTLTPVLLLTAVGLESLTSRRWRWPAGSILLLLCVLFSLGTFLTSSQKVQADWVGLEEYLEMNVGNRDRIVAPHIERVVAFLSPQLKNQFRPLSSWPAREKRGQIDRIFLIKSRYMTDDHRRRIERGLSRESPARITRMLGFDIYVFESEP